MSRTRFLVLAFLLLAGIGVTFGMVGNPFEATGYRPLARPFEEFPARIVSASGVEWTGEDRPLPATVTRIVGMDRYLRRDYRSEDGRNVLLFVSYFGNLAAGIDTIYHNPTVCFPTHGWTQVEEARALAGDVPVTKYRFVKGARETVVLNFFVVNGRSVARSAREDPVELARQKFSLASGPGYYAQVQVVASQGTGGADAGERALGFLAAAARFLFIHFEDGEGS
ncbi:MAG: exosortase C-terminal domain/associated protein EpsI [Planctomycetota bacterium]